MHISYCQKDQLIMYIEVSDYLFFSYIQNTKPKVAIATAMQTSLEDLFYVIKINSYKLKDSKVTYYFVSNLLVYLFQHL